MRVMTSPRSTDPGFVAAVATTTACTTNAQNSSAPLSLQEGRAETAGADAGHARTSIPLCLQPGSAADGPAKKRSIVSGTGSRRTNACADARATRKPHAKRNRPRIPRNHAYLPRVFRSDGTWHRHG